MCERKFYSSSSVHFFVSFVSLFLFPFHNPSTHPKSSPLLSLIQTLVNCYTIHQTRSTTQYFNYRYTPYVSDVPIWYFCFIFIFVFYFILFYYYLLYIYIVLMIRWMDTHVHPSNQNLPPPNIISPSGCCGLAAPGWADMLAWVSSLACQRRWLNWLNVQKDAKSI